MGRLSPVTRLARWGLRGFASPPYDGFAFFGVTYLTLILTFQKSNWGFSPLVISTVPYESQKSKWRGKLMLLGGGGGDVFCYLQIDGVVLLVFKLGIEGNKQGFVSELGH